MIRETGTKGFLIWLRQNYPQSYAQVAPRVLQLASRAKKTTLMGLDGDPMLDSIASNFDVPSMALPDAVTNPSIAIDVATPAKTSGSLADTLSNLIQSVGAGFLTAQQLATQKKVTDIQLQRAQAGLPPLNTAALNLPGVGVNVGLSSSTEKLVMYGGLALLAAMVLPKLLGARR